MKLRGGSLYIVIILLLLSSIIIGSILTISFYQKQLISKTVSKDAVRNLVDSALMLAINSDLSLENKKYSVFKVFPKDTSIVELEIKPWGALKIICASKETGNFRYKKIALAGSFPYKADTVSLYMADSGRGLSISGSTIIKGTCYLPEKNIRGASIEGQPYSGGSLVKGKIKPSKKVLPAYRPDMFSHAKNVISNLDEKNFKKVYIGGTEDQDIVNSFEEKPVLIFSNAELYLNKCNLEGNIIIFSEERVVIDPSCHIESGIVISPELEILDGFTGSIQAFCDSKIVVGKNCTLNIPSFLGISNPVSGYSGPRSIDVGENTIIHGGVIIEKTSSPSKVNLDKGANLYGQVYCPGQIILKGDVIGSIYCHSFYLKTERAQYINHLLNNILDPTLLSEYYCGPGILKSDPINRIAKWLD